MGNKKLFKNFIATIIFALIIASVGPSITGASTLNEENQIISALKLDPVRDSETIEYLESIDIKVIQDNKNVRIIESNENGQTYITKLDKKKNILTHQVKGDSSTKVKIDLNELANLEESLDDSEDSFTLAASTLKQNTYTNYEYTITFSSPEKWQLRRPDPNNIFKWFYKDRTKTSSNSTKLMNFKKAVDDLNYYEWMFIGSASATMIMTVAALIVAAITVGGGLAVALAGAGISGAAFNYALKMHQAANNAHYWYFQV